MSLTARERKSRRKTWTLPEVIRIPVQNEETEEIVEQIVLEKMHDPIVQDDVAGVGGGGNSRPRYRSRSIRLRLPLPAATHHGSTDGIGSDVGESAGGLFDADGPLPSWCSKKASHQLTPSDNMETGDSTWACDFPAPAPMKEFNSSKDVCAGTSRRNPRTAATASYNDIHNQTIQHVNLRSMRSGSSSQAAAAVAPIGSGLATAASSTLIQDVKRPRRKVQPVKPMIVVSECVIKPTAGPVDVGADTTAAGVNLVGKPLDRRQQLALWQLARGGLRSAGGANQSMLSKGNQSMLSTSHLDMSVAWRSAVAGEPANKKRRTSRHDSHAASSLVAGQSAAQSAAQRYDYKKNSKLASRECLAPQGRAVRGNQLNTSGLPATANPAPNVNSRSKMADMAAASANSANSGEASRKTAQRRSSRSDNKAITGGSSRNTGKTKNSENKIAAKSGSSSNSRHNVRGGSGVDSAPAVTTTKVIKVGRVNATVGRSKSVRSAAAAASNNTKVRR